MSRSKSQLTRAFRCCGALFMLSAFLLAHFQPASLMVALVAASWHGHDHEVTIQAHGNQLTAILTHPEESHASADRAPVLPGLTTASSSHEHESGHHVFHLAKTDVTRQLNLRDSQPQTQPPIQFTEIALPGDPSPHPPAFQKRSLSPPASSAILICLRTTVLLV